MATLLALVMANLSSDLTLLHIDNQHLSLQHHTNIIIPASGGQIDQMSHFPPETLF